ncbi:hypothetical protein BO71DRAFT_52614 [Aspergillus ellipticus CBS 707.79]|uniref:Uncharacterized protein n=1 Tax=Aspergillus ellipticus CBS 707.79 TaxID=1448320 RepID=A0A319DJB7_9EURO|nr:hypothetical protein BO71DRAFT_52614 [Aspergillus ellipticus CBS 707.79]
MALAHCRASAMAVPLMHGAPLLGETGKGSSQIHHNIMRFPADSNFSFFQERKKNSLWWMLPSHHGHGTVERSGD